MKTKILALVEQYIEFVVLGGVLIIFGLYAAQQFVGNPNAAKQKGSKELVSPGEVNETLETRAKLLKQGLAEGESSSSGQANLGNLTPPDASDLGDRFDEITEAPILPNEFLALAPAFKGPVDVTGDAPVVASKDIAVPVIPSATEVFAYQSYDTLTEEAVQSDPELASAFPQSPRDVSWLTVAARFDIDETLRRFAAKGPDGGPAISSRWYDDRVDVLDIKVERRRQMEDGTWSEPETIELLPGQVSFRAEIDGEVTARVRDAVLEELRRGMTQQQVVQPEFIATKSARWEDPEEIVARIGRGGGDDPGEMLRRLLDRRQRLEMDIQQAGGSPGGGGGGLG
ncbi:MAG: hypothetical protein MK100_09905, partial [Phycisphaerales bacterium]|nr:hypothetical protein [Phycisphaerales bacterium]